MLLTKHFIYFMSTEPEICEDLYLIPLNLIQVVHLTCRHCFKNVYIMLQFCVTNMKESHSNCGQLFSRCIRGFTITISGCINKCQMISALLLFQAHSLCCWDSISSTITCFRSSSEITSEATVFYVAQHF